MRQFQTSLCAAKPPHRRHLLLSSAKVQNWAQPITKALSRVNGKPLGGVFRKIVVLVFDNMGQCGDVAGTLLPFV